MTNVQELGFTHKYINQQHTRSTVKALCKVEGSQIDPYENTLLITNPVFINPAFIVVRNSAELTEVFTNPSFPAGGATIWLSPAVYSIAPDLIDVPDNVVIDGGSFGSVIRINANASSFFIRLGANSGIKNVNISREQGFYGSSLITMAGVGCWVKDCLILDYANNLPPNAISIEMTNTNQTIDGCFFRNSALTTGHDAITLSSSADNAIIRNNTFESYTNCVLLSGLAPPNTINDVKITENIFNNFAKTINATFVIEGLIANNIMVNSGGVGSSAMVLLTDVNRVNVQNNIFQNDSVSITSGIEVVDSGAGVLEGLLIESNRFSGFTTTTEIDYSVATSSIPINVQNNYFTTGTSMPFDGIGTFTGNYIATLSATTPVASAQQNSFDNRALYNTAFSGGGVFTPNLQYNRMVISANTIPLTISVPDVDTSFVGKTFAIWVNITDVGANGSTMTAVSQNNWALITFPIPGNYYVILIWNGQAWSVRELSQNVSIA